MKNHVTARKTDAALSHAPARVNGQRRSCTQSVRCWWWVLVVEGSNPAVGIFFFFDLAAVAGELRNEHLASGFVSFPYETTAAPVTALDLDLSLAECTVSPSPCWSSGRQGGAAGRQKDEGHRGYAATDQRYGEKTRYHAVRRASPPPLPGSRW